jgi:hypothetical protein
MFVVQFRTGTGTSLETPKQRRGKKKGETQTISIQVDAPSYPQAIARCREEYPHLTNAKIENIKRSY